MLLFSKNKKESKSLVLPAEVLPEEVGVFSGRASEKFRPWLLREEILVDNLNFNQIIEDPRIFTGSAFSAAQEDILVGHKIKCIFSIEIQEHEKFVYKSRSNNDFRKYQIISQSVPIYEKLGIARFHFRLNDDGSNSENQLKEAFELLERLVDLQTEAGDGSGLLVHCQLGASRSISLVAALIAKRNNISFEEAVRQIFPLTHIFVDQDLAVDLARSVGIQLDEFQL